MTTPSERYRLGIDLGGTKIEAVLMRVATSGTPPDPQGDTLMRQRIETRAEEGYDAILERVAGLIQAVEAQVPASSRESLCIGVGLPGHVSRQTGRVKNSNTVALNGRDLWGDLQRRLGRPVAFDNDANCFAMAEATLGAARGARCVFGVILGTGVGGGVVMNGSVWSGLQGIAGEWGHTVLELDGPPCYCGRRGCVEIFLSGPGLARALREGGSLETPRSLGQRLRTSSVLPALEEGVWHQYLDRFGRALAGVINVLDPEVIVLGGGMSAMEELYTRGREKVRPWVFNDELLTKVVPASLGDSAGVFGAAMIGIPASSSFAF